MIKSMTGYGKSVVLLHDQKLTVEIRALNSKQLDINMRIPQSFREKEIEIRNLLRNKLLRGKIDFSVYRDISDKSEEIIFNKIVARKYFQELQSFSKELNIADSSDYLALLTQLPNVFTAGEIVLNENDWQLLLKAINEAINNLIQFRCEEGKVLAADFVKRIEKILLLLSQVDKYESQRIKKIKMRIIQNLNEHLSDIQYDKNRLEQELIYYLEKLDVTEEKVRLKKHCHYFLDVMNTEETVGKKLSFVLQEIGREINTLGSKSNDADMQKIVVLMKDELEKMKEQMLNIL